ncbi:MAG: di-trans,poly-cis-decaprenylcistransferase [Omnitrophica bacterium RIFCSPHIGHO2_02_FULL_63_14]|nr:MAG: di-trans,poly-cis-decaprenylcistransferase [Omnitrophica bacterium RIFCSPHIGHO2_02_FULL_63_14]
MTNDLPRHVAIIMDGNGRWAQARGLPRVAGHRAGVRNVREIVKTAIELGIPVLTLYAFSQENWKRPPSEVSVLMQLLDMFLDKEIRNLQKQGIRLRTIGRIEALPVPILEKLRRAADETATNRKLILNIALNYGARTEILDAVNKIVSEAVGARHAVPLNGGLTEEVFSKYLYTSGLPDPDLLIRTSGEMRLSNFLLWQLSYAEIYITKKYWPDFRKADFLKALADYRGRERRFGDVHA